MSSPDSAALQNLFHAGNMERVEREARRFLGLDPEDRLAHFYLAHALLAQEDRKGAKPHIDFLLGKDPDSTSYRLLVIEYCRSGGQWAQLRRHVSDGLRIDSANADFHYYAAVGEAVRMRNRRAMEHIEQARTLAPDDPDIINLYLQLRGIEDSSATAAWGRVAEFEKALQFDPENASLHDSLGDVYLDALEDARTAEGHYREAVRLDPHNRHFQQDLFQAVAKRDLLYRLVSIPSRTYGWIRLLGEAITHQPWRLVFLFIGFKAVLAFLVWLTVMTVLLWPAGKIYEWLLVEELKSGSKTGLTHLRFWHRFQRLPRVLRFSLFLAVLGALYSLLFRSLDIDLETGFKVVGWIILIHFLLIVFFFVIRKARALFARRRSAKRAHLQ